MEGQVWEGGEKHGSFYMSKAASGEWCAVMMKE